MIKKMAQTLGSVIRRGGPANNQIFAIRTSFMHSGSKLVLGIFGLALAAGILSWWYRYEAAHRSTTFWGPNFAELIARPSDVTGFELRGAMEESADTLGVLSQDYERLNVKDLTQARGLVHLRNSILNDGNYRWQEPVDESVKNGKGWRYGLQFAGNGRTATLLFTDDFAVLGRLNQRGDNLRTVACQPMAETLREYFTSIKAFQPENDASKGPD